MSYAIDEDDPLQIAQIDVWLPTFSEKLKPRVAVRGRIEKMPEPPLNWGMALAVAVCGLFWFAVLNVGAWL